MEGETASAGAPTLAWLEITARRGEAPESLVHTALGHLEQLVSMLLALIKSCDR